MNKINLRNIIKERKPEFFNKPKIIQKIFLAFLESLLHIKDVNEVIEKNRLNMGIPFIDGLFDQLNFSYRISNLDVKRIPYEGRLIIVANHPIGSLDGLALLKSIYEIRRDVRIVANDLLMNIENLKQLFLPYNINSRLPQKKNILEIGNALENEEAVIMFPAAEVSRLKFYHVYDTQWTKGAVFFAKKYKSPVLPIYIQAKNSFLFYLVSVLFRPLSTLLLVREVFNKKNMIINIKIGDPIPARAFVSSMINSRKQTELLKQHVYSLGSKLRRSIYSAEKNIVHPVDRQALKRELKNSLMLGETSDNKLICLTDMETSPNIIEEISRLREVTFRKVNEGTGKSKDLDPFDRYYKHLFVWDEDELEIIGAYRIGIGKEITDVYDHKGFYSSTLFEFSDKLKQEYLPHAIEMGRSFIQKKYWNTNALNYLWQGIGAFLAHNRDVRFMFGPVSISNSYPDYVKELIVFYFKKWFGSETQLAFSPNPFVIPEKHIKKLEREFAGKNYREDYRILKGMLKPYGFSIPILYKHYSDLCEPGGVRFHDFGIDESFQKCVDGLLVVEVGKVKKEKFDRYILPYLNSGKD